MKTHSLLASFRRTSGWISPDGLSGVAGARASIPVDGVVAWVSDVERDVPVSVEGVRAHDAVVEAALEMGSTPVPARFGQLRRRCRLPRRSVESGGVGREAGDDGSGLRRDDARAHAVHAAHAALTSSRCFPRCLTSTPRARDAAISRRPGAGRRDGRGAVRS